MNINFNNSEVEEAMIHYVNHRGFSTDGQTVSIAFTKGRNGAGISADVTIEPTKSVGNRSGDEHLQDELSFD